MSKKKRDFRDIIVKIMAAIMAVLMVVAVAGTLIFYLTH